MFLRDKCAEITIEFLKEYNCYEQKNLFDSMERGMKAKMEKGFTRLMDFWKSVYLRKE